MSQPSRRQVAAALMATPVLARAGRALPQAAGLPVSPTTWDLSPLYPDEAAWEAAFVQTSGAIGALPSRIASSGANGAAALLQALIVRSDCQRVSLRLGTYAQLKADADLTSGADQNRRAKAETLDGAVSSASSALDAALLAMGRGRIFAALDGHPELGRFRYGLERLFRLAPHTPAPAAAAVLAAAQPLFAMPEDIYHQIIGAVPKPDAERTSKPGVATAAGAQGPAIASAARAERVAARAARSDTLRGFAPAVAATLTAYVRGRALQARTSGYDSVEAAVLTDAGIPSAVLQVALAQAKQSLPLLHRYVELRRRKLGVDRLTLADFSAPLARAKPTFALPRIRELTLRAVAPLGSDYQRRLDEATMARWMDVYPRPGKAGGGYCNYDAYNVHPYILFNLGEDYQSLSEFAHEWGHALHARLAAESQPFDLAIPTTFTTEVAATCHEQLLVRDLIARADDADERSYYLWRKALFQVGFFYQTLMKTELEQFIHAKVWAGGGISVDDLNDRWSRLLKEYWGDGVQIDPGDELGWVQNWQLFNAFYNFQYATSITGAVHFSKALRSDEAGAKTRYLSLLKAGASDDAYNLLRAHGLDLADAAPYRAFVADLASTLQALH